MKYKVYAKFGGGEGGGGGQMRCIMGNVEVANGRFLRPFMGKILEKLRARESEKDFMPPSRHFHSLLDYALIDHGSRPISARKMSQTWKVNSAAYTQV